MKTKILLCIFFLAVQLTYGQTVLNCKCPPHAGQSATPSKIFKFSNGNFIALCSAFKIDNFAKRFADFELFECGIKQSLGWWEAHRSCSIVQKNDTLLIKEFYEIPNGTKFAYKPLKIFETKYYWQKSKLIQQSFISIKARKYTKREINIVLLKYKRLRKGSYPTNIIKVADELFWAFVSNSKLAEQYLKDVNKKFGPFDGEFQQNYMNLFDVYERYKAKHQIEVSIGLENNDAVPLKDSLYLINKQNNKSVIASGKKISKANVSKDSLIFVFADIHKDYRIFGYEKPDKKSKKLLLFSVFTNDVENNPFACQLGSYYGTEGMKDIKLKFISKTKGFVKVEAISNTNIRTTLFFEEKWIDFRELNQ